MTHRPHGESQTSDFAAPHRLLAAGLPRFPPPRHGGEHRIGERRTSQITLAVLSAQQQRTKPAGLRGVATLSS